MSQPCSRTRAAPATHAQRAPGRLRSTSFGTAFGLDDFVKHELHVADRGKGTDPTTFGAGSFFTRTIQWTCGDRKGEPCKEYHCLSPNGDRCEADMYEGW